MDVSLQSLHAGQFQPLIGADFELHIDGGELLCLQLSGVETLGHRRPDAVRDPFSITFRGERGWRLVQGIQSITHPAIGTLKIFITQVGDGPEGSLFEAVFT